MRVARHGLCGNGDCTAILDAPPTPFLDVFSGEEVGLCPACAAAAADDPRFDLIDPTAPEGARTEGAGTNGGESE